MSNFGSNCCFEANLHLLLYIFKGLVFHCVSCSIKLLWVIWSDCCVVGWVKTCLVAQHYIPFQLWVGRHIFKPDENRSHDFNSKHGGNNKPGKGGPSTVCEGKGYNPTHICHQYHLWRKLHYCLRRKRLLESKSLYGGWSSSLLWWWVYSKWRQA